MKINAVVEVPEGPNCWQRNEKTGWSRADNGLQCQFLNRNLSPPECRAWDEKIKGGPIRGYKKCQQCLDAEAVKDRKDHGL